MGSFIQHLDPTEEVIFQKGVISMPARENVHELLINGLDDPFDSPEDSPLLTEDDYGVLRLTEEFHCHQVLTEYHDTQSHFKLVLVSVLCFCFILIELIGGYFAGSLAILTDAAHLFSDFIGFLISLVAISIGKWNATNSMTFGYYRAEVLGAFLSVITIWILEAIFVFMAVQRLWTMEFSIQANRMLIIASIGVGINLLMAGVLHGSFNHAHTTTTTTTFTNHHHNHNDNINIRAAAAHVIGDILQSLGVLVAAVLIKVFPTWKVADPICTLIFATIAVAVTFRVAKDSALILLEANTRNITDLGLALRHLEGVRHLHGFHVWTLAPGRDAVAVHLAVDEGCDRELILKEANEVIYSSLKVVSCTIQLEEYNNKLIQDCVKCQSIF